SAIGGRSSKPEPQLPSPKLLYRLGGLSHTLSHRLSHSLSHMTNDLPGPIVPPAREGHRRTFSEADKRRIVEEDGASGSQPVGGSAQLRDRGACPVPMEAGTDAGGTAVRGSRDHGRNPAN